jgi:phosphoribosylamine---glycine ligase
MIVGVIGSGGREHSICEALYKSKDIDKIFCFPGNAGTATTSQNIDIDINDYEKLKKFILANKIELIIVGPEKPLVEGMVDFFEKNNIKIFGPNKIASQLEGSKIFTKKLCDKYKIPTAAFGIYENIIDANEFIEKNKFPIVVKADGLAAGKGVYICEDKNEAQNAIREIFDGKFGNAKSVLLEEFLKGEEMSYFIISDGINIKKFQTAQDHKRVLEGDLGKNTGGMGAYSPSRLNNENLDNKILEKIIYPTMKGLKNIGTNYKGFLYAGLMIVDNEPYLIEYNVRMGDPECQTILPRLKSDFLSLINDCCTNNLLNTNIEWHNKKSLCIVLCSKGYPDKYNNNILIKKIDEIKLLKDEFMFHAGTKLIDNEIYSNGGRVLNFVCLSTEFKHAREKTTNLIKSINWPNGFYRKDIGYKVID